MKKINKKDNKKENKKKDELEEEFILGNFSFNFLN